MNARRVLLRCFLIFWLAALASAQGLPKDSEPPEIASLRLDRQHDTETLQERIAQWADSAPTEVDRGWAQLALGEFADELEQPDQAYARFDEALRIAKAEVANDLAIAVLSRLSSMYANRGDLERASKTLQEMESIARTSSRKDWQSLWAYNRGVLERKLGNFEEALRRFDESNAMAIDTQDLAQQARAHNASGLILARTGRFFDALEHHNQALHLARGVNDSAEIARTYRMLGFLHRNLDDDELAAKNMREALKHLGPRDIREDIALRGELARSLLNVGAIDEAATFSEAAAKRALNQGSPPNKVNAFTVMSSVRLAQGRLDEAELWSRRASEQFDSVAIRDRAQIHANRAAIAQARNDIPTALQEARAALEANRKIGDKVLERSALETLANVELAAGDFAAAIETRHAFQQLDKKLAIDIAGRRIAILEGNLAAQRAESQRKLLARDNQIQSLRIERQRQLGIALIVVLVVMAALAVLLLRRYREVRRLHEALIASNAELERVARTDALTGIANRGAVTEQFEKLLAETQAARRQLAVLLIDIDHFKRINDHHGHLAGDAVLRATAQRMQNVMPETAKFGRWGGEEFIAILPDLTPKEASDFAERVRLVIAAEPFHVDDSELAVSISIGVTSAPRPERRGIDRLIATADAALYRAKNSGRNRVEVG